ncbi:MAG: hypothetical protein M3083_08760 [Actinomycetota bacterium]|nr:hypothetical protein [Actinomycetota bacterium]
MSGSQRYQLSARTSGTAMFGLTVPQIGLLIAGVLVALRTVSVGGPTPVHFLVGAAAVGSAAVLAFTPWAGRKLYEMVPTALRFSLRAATDANRWFAPIPALGIDGRPLSKARLPRCLAGLEIRSVPRPAWAGMDQSMGPLGLAVDRRSGAVTGVVSVKGSEFQLIPEPDQHYRIFGWNTVLAQFAREAAPVARICWHEWSSPAPLSEHLDWLAANSNPAAPAAGPYRQLLGDLSTRDGSSPDPYAQQSARVARHELRVTVTVHPRNLRRRRRSGARAKRDAAGTAVQMLQTLTQRCRAAALVVSPPLSPAQIAETVRVQGDPDAIRSLPQTRGLGERAGVVPAAYGPLAMDVSWDAVRIDRAWHRCFWVQSWPTLEVEANWIEPLLLDTIGTRTVTMIMEPVDPATSRRHMSKEAVGIEASIDLRDKKGFRVPAELRRAQSDLDRREVEITTGSSEYAYLALIEVAAESLDMLDELTNAYVTVAAQCGLELRSLDGRHDAAWACTLPIGRAPDKDLLGAVKG